MLNRFIGNKKQIIEPLMAEIGRLAGPGDLVCDIFSGTLAVSLELKRRGYRVASNDINLFSHYYGQAFLLNSCPPTVDLDSLLGSRAVRLRREHRDTRHSGGDGKADPGVSCQCDLSVLLDFLGQNSFSRLPRKARRTDIFDTYSEDGANSEYRSSRGTTGRRRFFTGENALRIDYVLNWVRFWSREGLLSEQLRAVILCTLLDAVERISNTQGTYHDFPRGEYDPRALSPLQLRAPSAADFVGYATGHILGRAEDSLDFIRRVPRHRVLYIDPPYNFRQYTAYYFLPNLLCRYWEIEDLDDYFRNVQFVRGQNMDDDYTSPFSLRTGFVPALRQLIDSADADFVVLSYFNGRNHWSEFRDDAGVGMSTMEELFQSSMFEASSSRVIPVSRSNYQSYGGYRSETVEELIFTAQKAKTATSNKSL